MAIERDDKLLNGAGLSTYTGLLKTKLDGITTTIAGDITTAVTTAVNAATTALIGDATADGDTLGKLEDRIESAESGLETVITEVFGEYPGVEPSRIDNLESDLDGVTTTISGMQDDIDGITTYIESITNTIAGLTGTYKALQNASTFTAPAGSYISGIEQNEQGVVTATTTALPTVDNASDSTPGLVQMASSATTYVVYDTVQVDDIISGVESAIDGITTTIDEMQGDISGISTTVEGLEEVINGITTPLDETFKALQTAATLNAPSGEYISGITQDAQGVVGITTIALPTASTTGLGMVQVVAAQTPVVGDYVVYSKDAVDEIVLDIQGGGSGLDSRYKKIQTAVTNPVASGNAITFISSIEQDAQGVITATAATVSAASTTGLGLVQYATGVTTASPRVYDTTEVDRLIAEAEAAAFVAAITSTLPASGDANTIYFVDNGSGTTPNYYTEYMYVNNGWEVVGNTELAIEALNDTEIENIFNTAFSD